MSKCKCGLDLAEWLERPTVNAVVATVLVRSQRPPTQLKCVSLPDLRFYEKMFRILLISEKIEDKESQPTVLLKGQRRKIFDFWFWFCHESVFPKPLSIA
jgi:hypothetical protein